MSIFTKAVRKKAKLRLGITGPAGAGKTYSALLIAKGLDGKVALIDTEHGSGDLYANMMDYDTCIIEAPFLPIKYIELIKMAEQTGYNTIILDSITHAWAGEGGLLDIHGKLSEIGTNSYTAWRKVTPMHNAFVEAMLQSKCNIIATMRSKVDYVLEVSEKGKQVPRKVGLAPIQREGMDYEFTTVFDLAQENHLALVGKDRTSLFKSEIPFIITEKTGNILKEWLETGIEIPKEKETTEIVPSLELIEQNRTFLKALEKIQGRVSSAQFAFLCLPFQPLEQLFDRERQIELYNLIQCNKSST